MGAANRSLRCKFNYLKQLIQFLIKIQINGVSVLTVKNLNDNLMPPLR